MARRSKNVHIGGFQETLFTPNSEWRLPTEWPDLSAAKIIGIDIESKDPNLTTQGPGFIRGDARPVGVSIATDYGFKMYLPFGHERGEQFEQSKVVDYLKTQLGRDNQIKTGANLMYELEALAWLGVEMRGPLADIQVAEPLLDEERIGGFSLDTLSWAYLGKGKNEEKLRQAAAAFNLDPKKDMWRLDPKYVGAYAEDDALYPIEILKHQLKRLSDENLMDVWHLESKLLPVLFKMRARGIRVDLDKAEKLSGEMRSEEERLIGQVWERTGFKVDPWSSKSLAVFLNQMGLGFYIEFTKPTKNFPEGQPSFKNEWFLKMGDQHEAFGWLRDIRVMSKIRRDFVDNLILNNNVRGRLHPQWHQLRESEDDRENGARTGRIASSKPCLTNIPIRDPKWGPRMRGLFTADEGGQYCKNDYSSQEPRILLHWAYLKRYAGTAEARQRYIDDPYTDYHQMVADMIKERTGRHIDRRPAKDINLGSAYGMGFDKLANKLGLSIDDAKSLLRTYHEGVPYVKKLEERCMEIVHGQGFIRTISGRKRRFNSWEPRNWDLKRVSMPVNSYEEAVERWGSNVERSGAHKALNAICQGSAADQTKTAIVLLDEEGLTPQIQVYDELGQTIWDPKDAWRIKEVMESAIKFEIPHLADPEVGPSWGEVVESKR